MRVAINGLGRIGRATFKILATNPELEVVAINDLMPADNLAYLLNHDTVYGRYPNRVTVRDRSLATADRSYPLFAESDPARLPWGEWKVDLVFECTGRFNRRHELSKHLDAGAKRVILSAPSKDHDIPTVVFGVNVYHEKDGPILSCASCTTNCVAPVVEIVSRHLGLRKAVMNTVHAYTASQAIVDGPNKKFRRGRTGAANLVPSATGAATATTQAFPDAPRTISRHGRSGASAPLFHFRYCDGDAAVHVGRRSQQPIFGRSEERPLCRSGWRDGGSRGFFGYRSRFPGLDHRPRDDAGR